METKLLILSIVACHYPSGLFRDTQRRYSNMRRFGKNIRYDFKNQITPFTELPIYKYPYALLSFIAGAILPIFSLMALDLSWLLAIVLNVVLYAILGPFLAFITTPFMTIFNKQALAILTIISLIAGIILYFFAKAI